ncbi:RNA polymerase sigma factor [Amycolatopsis balhimycina DSM 5908]|uniref:RNA polymerase sigma factor n=1 Tax=Amycolatopsis balhimycina DSM 5908 TaxID=1081091 RepID=A0A428W3S1_AMYBA|nr:RNA polymerase sigma factor [Amycolatopsis balhimycina]RSM37696.1 RNA polymerase sigma factor [Amycolatopsis balhimycina DSM 5908]
MRTGVRAGDHDAFAELFDRHAGGVYNHAFRLTWSWSTAEDVVALTFLEAWRLRYKVDPEGGSLLPWLLGIATNVARNTTRSARRYQAALTRLHADRATPDFAQDVVDRVDDVRAVAAARAALERLRPGERDVVALVVWAGLDQASAAQALGISVGTVRSRLSRARANLRATRDSAAARERHGASGQIQGSHTTVAWPGQEARDER